MTDRSTILPPGDCAHAGTLTERRRADCTVEFTCSDCGHVLTHSDLLRRRERETSETGRRTYRCTSAGFSADGVWIVGPVLVDVVTWQRVDPRGERTYRPSYTVEIDGRHSHGGEIAHLDNGVPRSSWLLGWTPLEVTSDTEGDYDGDTPNGWGWDADYVLVYRCDGNVVATITEPSPGRDGYGSQVAGVAGRHSTLNDAIRFVQGRLP